MSDYLFQAEERARKAEALVAELEQDAKRYRALRDSGKYSASHFGGWGLAMVGNTPAAELDAAADKLINP